MDAERLGRVLPRWHPVCPAGLDSIGVDPALFSISLLDRIEVERWPGQLRVHLFTRRLDLLAPRSRIAVARGDNDYARYEASLERRFVLGLGFALAADYLSSPTASGSSSDYSNTQIWAQGSYIPSQRFGVQYQLVRSAPNRDPYVSVATGTDRHDRPRLRGQAHRCADPNVAAGAGHPRARASRGSDLRPHRLDRRRTRAADQSDRRLSHLPGADLLPRWLRFSPHPLDSARRAGKPGLEPHRAVQRQGESWCT